MDRQIGKWSAVVCLAGVTGFAIGMIIGEFTNSDYLTYIACAFIAFGYLPLACAFAQEKSSAAGKCGIAFGAVYATVSLLVLFANLTVVQYGNLSDEVLQILDYQRMGLFFNYDLLCYCFMAVSTFFAGLNLQAKIKTDKALKILLLAHGVFAISCFIMPMFNIFNDGQSPWIGIGLLEFWCILFAAISVFAYLHFAHKGENI